MELRQLIYFVTVSETLSFSEAAKRLFITQGTLSQQIASLEDELGQRLFERTSRKVILSDAGAQLLPLAIRTVEDSRRCTQRMKDMAKELSGTLRIGVTYCFDEFIVNTVKEFNRAHPKVKLVIIKKTAATLLAQLRQRKLDLVLAFRPTDESPDIDPSPLFSTSAHVIVRSDHPLASLSSVTVEQIRPYGLILPGVSHNARRSFDDFVTVDTSEMNVRMEVDEPEMLLDLVRATGHVGVLAPVAIEERIRYGGRTSLKAIPIEGFENRMQCCVHVLRNSIEMASRTAFVKMLKDNIRIMIDPKYLSGME